MQNKYLFGITGGSGSGKSTVSDMFRSLGFDVIDCDKAAHRAYETKECLEELVSEFGDGVLTEDGAVNRRALGAIVFSDSAKLEALNGIVHKYVIREVFRFAESSAKEFIGVDGAVLFESGITEKLSCVIGVIADREKRIERIMSRDGITYADAEKRINSQKVDKFFIDNCDCIIYNNNSGESLEQQVREVASKLAEENEKRKSE